MFFRHPMVNTTEFETHQCHRKIRCATVIVDIVIVFLDRLVNYMKRKRIVLKSNYKIV